MLNPMSVNPRLNTSTNCSFNPDPTPRNVNFHQLTWNYLVSASEVTYLIDPLVPLGKAIFPETMNPLPIIFFLWPLSTFTILSFSTA